MMPVARRPVAPRLIVLAALVLGIAALVVVLNVVQNRPAQLSKAEPAAARPQISEIGINRISAVSLTGPGREQPFAMRRVAGNWQIDGVGDEIPIDPSRIDDLLRSFGDLRAQRVIEEDAADLAQYGLDPPQVVASAIIDDGRTIELYLGNRTAVGNTWYLRTPDRRTVYTVWLNHGNHFHFTARDLRGDQLPAIVAEAITYLLLREARGRTIEITEPGAAEVEHVFMMMSRLVMIQPYALPRAINSEKFAELQQGIAGVRIDRIVSDDPAAAAGYGLDPPRYRLIVRDREGGELELLLGDEIDGERLFQLPGRATVYAMQQTRTAFLELSAFDLVDKFVLIQNIDTVDAVDVAHPAGSNRLTIARTGTAAEDGEGVESFALDGAPMEDKPFRELYQLVIGLLADAEVPAAAQAELAAAPPEVRITYTLNTPPEVQLAVALVPYDRQFYAAVREGAAEFLVSRAQVSAMLDALAVHATS